MAFVHLTKLLPTAKLQGQKWKQAGIIGLSQLSPGSGKLAFDLKKLTVSCELGEVTISLSLVSFCKHYRAS